mmetsp:Transcript_33684/g.24348  ORF Transcript_33684/g.24348 Transcript_33684/m.24348 type:complete len:100 (+) Transcript_33684:1778-2077(+)
MDLMVRNYSVYWFIQKTQTFLRNMKSEDYLDHFSQNFDNYKVIFKSEMHMLAMSSLDIVDAFDISDRELLSVLGKKSYKDSEEMYQTLMDVVRKNPLNQ